MSLAIFIFRYRTARCAKEIFARSACVRSTRDLSSSLTPTTIICFYIYLIIIIATAQLTGGASLTSFTSRADYTYAMRRSDGQSHAYKLAKYRVSCSRHLVSGFVLLHLTCKVKIEPLFVFVYPAMVKTPSKGGLAF